MTEPAAAAGAGRLHVVTDHELALAELRAAAYGRFIAYYRHNRESQRTMIGALRRMAVTFTHGRYNERTFPWDLLVDDELARRLWESAETGRSRNTALRDASALRMMLRACNRVGLMSREVYRAAASFETKNVGTLRPPAGRYLSEGDMARILYECRFGSGHEHTRIRDAALVMVLASTGARVHEISCAPHEFVKRDEGSIWLPKTKAGVPRTGWLHPAALDYLEEWIQIRGTAPGPLFVPLARNGRPMPEHGALSSYQIWKIVKRRAAAAGIAGVATHDLRRFMISNLLTTTDITRVSNAAGHAKISTTAAYDRRPAEMQRQAVATLTLPFRSDLPSLGGRVT